MLISFGSSSVCAQDIESGAIEIVILGIAQDAGIPHAGCQRTCCLDKWDNPELQKHAVSLGMIDHITKQFWMIEATPDFKWQHQYLESLVSSEYSFSGVFITHAHIGHYSGLIHLGKEVMGSSKVPVYVMPRMSKFLNENGPWDQLVSLGNIELYGLKEQEDIKLSDQVAIEPIIVPHRDEYSETVGFRITGPEKSILFIPDIDKWHIWDKDIKEEISKVDLAFLDGTFYANFEIPYRDISLIPHPFVSETMELLDTMSSEFKDKIYFIHFNHTNPIVSPDGIVRSAIEDKGYHCAEEKSIFGL